MSAIPLTGAFVTSRMTRMTGLMDDTENDETQETIQGFRSGPEMWAFAVLGNQFLTFWTEAHGRSEEVDRKIVEICRKVEPKTAVGS